MLIIDVWLILAKYLLKILAVTALPIALYLWIEYATPRQREKYKAWFWTFIVVVFMFGVIFELATTGSIGLPNPRDSYGNPGY